MWESIVSNLSTLDRLFSYTDFHDNFKKYAVEMFKPTIDRLGWDTKDTDSKLGYFQDFMEDTFRILWSRVGYFQDFMEWLSTMS